MSAFVIDNEKPNSASGVDIGGRVFSMHACLWCSRLWLYLPVAGGNT